MRFAFTDDQLAFRDAVRDLLAKECPPDGRARGVGVATTGRLPGLWSQLAEMGVVGLLAPEAHGGLGLAELDLVRSSRRPAAPPCPSRSSRRGAVAVPRRPRRTPTPTSPPTLAAVGSRPARPRSRVGLRVRRLGAPRRRPPTPSCSRPTTGCTCSSPSTVDARTRSSRSTARAGSARVTVDAVRPRPCVAGGAAGLAQRRGLRPGRRRHRRRSSCGLGRPHARDHRRVRRRSASSSACRSAVVPGGEAPPGRRLAAARVRPAAGAGAAAYSLAVGDPHARRCTSSMAKAQASDAAEVVGRQARCSATAPSATRSSTTCTSS